MLNKPVAVMDGIWQMRLPLPFELDHVNVYLVELRDGYMLVDCGLGTEESYGELTAQLGEIGVPVSAIREIFLTHTHPDHVGLAKRLLDETGAGLHMHAAELDQLTRIARSADKPLWLDEVLHRAGVPADLIERIEGSFDRIRRNFVELIPHRVLTGEETIEMRSGVLELVLTPGHSPGHLCLYDRGTRTLLSGDHVLQWITPNIGWLPERDALGEFYESLDRIAVYEAERILPGHGKIFSDLKGYVTKTKGHHDARCAQIVEALRGQAKTAHALVSDLWARPLAPFHHRFAVFEVLAHLEYLWRRGEIRREGDGGWDLWIAS
ncbi:MAG: MBL fold metallo-hydrolase [Acidobacteria bacterium]|nr:MBL fold metallo-hydrolase [Acidobacteriota bacterium]